MPFDLSVYCKYVGHFHFCLPLYHLVCEWIHFGSLCCCQSNAYALHYSTHPSSLTHSRITCCACVLDCQSVMFGVPVFRGCSRRSTAQKANIFWEQFCLTKTTFKNVVRHEGAKRFVFDYKQIIFIVVFVVLICFLSLESVVVFFVNFGFFSQTICLGFVN